MLITLDSCSLTAFKFLLDKKLKYPVPKVLLLILQISAGYYMVQR